MSRNRARKVQLARRRAFLRPLVAVAAGVVLLVAAFFALRKPTPVAAVEVRGAPALRADQQKVDLGDVKLGKTVEVSFRLSNVGDQPLRFSEPPYIEVVEGC